MRMTANVEKEIKGNVVRVTLNRPEVHNAFNDAVIKELTDIFSSLDKDPKVRVVVLSAKGKSFCAGGDLNWMKSTLDYSHKENIEDAKKLGVMFKVIDECSKPVIGRVHGTAIGGGVGLVSVCDICVALEGAKFSLSEVKLGLLPAVISPFVMKRIIPGEARRYFLTSERFSASEAKRIGLISEVVTSEEELDKKINEWIDSILKGGPEAVSLCKKMIHEVPRMDLDKAIDEMAKGLADRRVSKEGQEGMKAFFEKRLPNWVGPDPKGV